MEKIVKQVMLNHLIYNPNRDPEVYRRHPGEPFHLQVLLGGKGKAKVALEAEGKTLCQGETPLPGTFACEIAFDTPGLHPGFLSVEADGHTYRQYLPLDVEAPTWAH